ncbi:N-acetylmuramidase domain-containing protein [Flexibacterium corallicola]|uniref:N-acetylmuramidase domain-containing protein n=1 Tax=Flexibacterium corallicola TaxID=3037259 RepID=UPI00286F092C|nr:N-acetylmuramidase domain-containing protein [Pseudovibrio sp. M1P-2-3]
MSRSNTVSLLRSGGGQELDTTDALERWARAMQCDEDVLQAILEVESKGDAFDHRGRLIILPEKHVFYRELPKELRAKAVRQGLAVKRWSKANYKGLGKSGSNERWDLLERMADFHEEAALKSCSYGMAQIMGFNHAKCDHASVTGFVRALAQNSLQQVDAFLSFLDSSGLDDALRKGDFRAIARVYNGSGQVEFYAQQMAQAYARLSGEDLGAYTHTLQLGSSGYRVRALQGRLAELGYAVKVDGDFGPATRRAVVAFQVDNGLTVDGVVGRATQDDLETASHINQTNGNSRADLTVKTLRKQGSKTVQKADRLTQLGSGVLATSAAVTGLDLAPQNYLERLSGWSEQFGMLRIQLAPLYSLVMENKWMLAIAVGVAVIIFARQIKQRRLEDAQNWRTI